MRRQQRSPAHQLSAIDRIALGWLLTFALSIAALADALLGF